MSRSRLTTAFLLMALPNFGNAQSAYPEPDMRLEVGDWLFECYGAESREGNCQLYQRILMNNATEIALVFTVAYAPDGRGPFLQAALPLGSDLAAGARVVVGEAFDQVIPFSQCTDQGCLVEGEITAGLLSAMRTTPVTYITVGTREGPLSIPLSMNGFGSGIDRLKPINTAPPQSPAPALELAVEPAPAVDNDLAPVTGD